MADGSAFQILHLAQVKDDLLSLYEKIACEKGRVEILHSEGGCQCVLISKAELDSLEEALEVLSNQERVRQLRETLALFAAAAQPISASMGD